MSRSSCSWTSSPWTRRPLLHKLIKAYRGLRIDDFGFHVLFKEAGFDLDGKDEHGQTFVDVIKISATLPSTSVELIANARA